MLDCAAADVGRVAPRGRRTGWWECDLANDTLSWSGGVYDIFGLPRGASIARSDALARYTEQSRAVLERLRAEAIRTRSGFTLDAELQLGGGQSRWMRVICAPDLSGGQVVRLHGLKLWL